MIIGNGLIFNTAIHRGTQQFLLVDIYSDSFICLRNADLVIKKICSFLLQKLVISKRCNTEKKIMISLLILEGQIQYVIQNMKKRSAT